MDARARDVARQCHSWRSEGRKQPKPAPSFDECNLAVAKKTKTLHTAIIDIRVGDGRSLHLARELIYSFQLDFL